MRTDRENIVNNIATLQERLSFANYKSDKTLLTAMKTINEANETVTPKKLTDKKYYEKLTMLATFLVSAGSISIYLETLKKANMEQKLSGIGVNFFENIFFIKVTLDKLAQRLEKGEYAKTVAIATLAVILYGPQVLTTILESSFSPFVTSLTSAAVGISGIGLYGFAVNSMFEFAEQLNCCKKQAAITPALENRARDEVPSVGSSDLTEAQQSLEEKLVDALIVLAQQTKPKFEKFSLAPATIGKVVKVGLQVGTASALVYGAYAYECATDVSEHQDFKFSDLLAVISAYILMSPQFALSARGGFNLVSNIADAIIPAYKYNSVSNNFKLGGNIGAVLTALSFPAAIIAGSESGKTSKELYDQNCNTKDTNQLMFPGADVLTDYSARAFNAIFCEMAFCWFIAYTIQHAGTSDTIQNDRAYLQAQDFLAELAGKVGSLSDDQLSQMPGYEQLKEENFFTARTLPRVNSRDSVASNQSMETLHCTANIIPAPKATVATGLLSGKEEKEKSCCMM
ncbi:MAG: hypothetical protein NTZ67_08995 [Gammaproteobacteria bacterium]|nr:hypothetical protein [Gammaproteobacteria bacterium]